MGKGDRKSKRGKIFMGSYGKSRPARRGKAKVVATAAPVAVTKKAAPKKRAAPKKKKEPES
ncbi:MAG TPA: 30S ribosomal protein THX [Bacteroidia bacterium]|nr:30S ribosomal protein THX [Bacteroidia bacterium]